MATTGKITDVSAIKRIKMQFCSHEMSLLHQNPHGPTRPRPEKRVIWRNGADRRCRAWAETLQRQEPLFDYRLSTSHCQDQTKFLSRAGTWRLLSGGPTSKFPQIHVDPSHLPHRARGLSARRHWWSQALVSMTLEQFYIAGFDTYQPCTSPQSVRQALAW